MAGSRMRDGRQRCVLKLIPYFLLKPNSGTRIALVLGLLAMSPASLRAQQETLARPRLGIVSAARVFPAHEATNECPAAAEADSEFVRSIADRATVQPTCTV